MSDRSTAIKAAQTILASDRAVFLKVETTGVSPTDEVVEIAIIHATSGDILLNTLVRPSFRYKMHDKLKHGITYDMLADAPTIAEIDLNILSNRQIIVYGKDFAHKMISQSCAARSVAGIYTNSTWHCVMTLYGAFEGVMSEYGSGFKWWKFDDACENMHINNEKRNHRALEEARSIGLLLYKIAASGDAVKIAKRDPLPRPNLNGLFDPLSYHQSNHDMSAAFASSGYPTQDELLELEQQKGQSDADEPDTSGWQDEDYNTFEDWRD